MASRERSTCSVGGASYEALVLPRRAAWALRTGDRREADALEARGGQAGRPGLSRCEGSEASRSPRSGLLARRTWCREVWKPARAATPHGNGGRGGGRGGTAGAPIGSLPAGAVVAGRDRPATRRPRSGDGDPAGSGPGRPAGRRGAALGTGDQRRARRDGAAERG